MRSGRENVVVFGSFGTILCAREAFGMRRDVIDDDDDDDDERL